MAEQREIYKGREIIVRTGTEASAAGAGGAQAMREQGKDVTQPELLIDGERVFTVRNAAGAFIASGLAFDPQPSPIDLARKIIDYKEAGE